LNSVPYSLRFFLSALLISACFLGLNGQTQPADTLKKVTASTLTPAEGSIEEPVDYGATDSTVALIDRGIVLLYGDAYVNYGTMKMKAGVIEINYTNNIVKAYGRTDTLGNRTGSPIFNEGDETMQADTIKYNLKTKKGKIYNALTKQGELLVIGNEIKKDSDDVVYMKNMKCIPCQEEDARTAFRATKAKIIPDDKIVTGPMYLEIGGIPTPLGLPFGYFPNTKKQHNGILLPTYGYSPEYGFNLRDGGYYFGFNDKTDMTIRGNIYGNGSWMLGSTNDYNILYKCNGSTFLSYSEFHNGEKEIPMDERKLPNAYTTERSYVVMWKHNQDNKSNPTVRFSADVNYRKNQAFNRLNAINSAQFLQNTFQSNITFSKSWKFGTFSLNGLHSQNAITKHVDLTFPAFTFNVNRFFPFKRKLATRQNVFDKLGVNYLVESRSLLSGHEDSIFMQPLGPKIKTGIRHSLPISTNFNILRYITATPALQLNAVMYNRTIRKEYSPFHGDRPAAVATATINEFAMGYDATFSTAFNTQVFFDYVFKGGAVKQIRHMLIPTLSYNYRPDYGQEHYGFWKSVQADSLGNTSTYSIFEQGIFSGPAQGKLNGLSVNLNNNIEGKIRQKTDSGVIYKKTTIIQNISATGGYNFAADSFKLSPLGLSMRSVLFKYFDMVGNFQFTAYKHREGTARAYMNEYLWNEGRLVRFEQGSISVNTSIGSNMLEAIKRTREPNNHTNAAERGGEVRTNEAPETLPWTLRISYNLILQNFTDRKILPSHTMNFSADMTPTKFWKVGVTSGFDFNTLGLSYTRISIYRDLKCWEARIDWVPLGKQRSYSVSINMKLSMLSDFKIPRQRQWYDFQ
jgi:hypothetical protein